MVRNAWKRQFGPNGVDRVHSLRKILTQLGGTNFCTSSARFPPSFVGQPNSPEYTQMVRNAPTHQFRVKWGGSSTFVVKNSEATSWHELLHYSGWFCTEFRKATKRRQFRVQWVGSGEFVAKNSDATSWLELLH